MELRSYQQDCISTIETQPPGSYLVQMATGLGKTVTFANLPRYGERMLILSHQEELVEQPQKYFDCTYGERAVHTRNGDYAPGELDAAMEGPADAIAQTYREHAAGATLIFAVSVHQAEEIAGRIKGAVVVTGETKNRAAIIEAFTAGKIPCIVNCMGITGKASLCTAPRLLGLDVGSIPAGKRSELQGDLFELPLKAAATQDCPESWIRNVEIVDLFSMGFRPGLWGGRYSTFIPVRLYRLFPFFALLLHIEYGHAHLHRVISFADRSKPLHIFCDSKPLR